MLRGGTLTRHRVGVAMGFPEEVWQAFVTALPGPVGFRLRERFWRHRVRYMGANVRIDVGVGFHSASHIHLSDNCYIDKNVLIVAGPLRRRRRTQHKDNPDYPLAPGEVFIGENAFVGPNCVLIGIGGLYVGRNAGIAANSSVYSVSHHYRNTEDVADEAQYSFTSQAGDDEEFVISGAVFIGDYCAVGLGSTVLPGTSLRKGTWVSSNTVVQGHYAQQSVIRSSKANTVESLSHLSIREQNGVDAELE